MRKLGVVVLSVLVSVAAAHAASQDASHQKRWGATISIVTKEFPSVVFSADVPKVECGYDCKKYDEYQPVKSGDMLLKVATGCWEPNGGSGEEVYQSAFPMTSSAALELLRKAASADHCAWQNENGIIEVVVMDAKTHRVQYRAMRRDSASRISLNEVADRKYSGVFASVDSVEPDGVAANIGLEKGDLIFRLDFDYVSRWRFLKRLGMDTKLMSFSDSPKDADRMITSALADAYTSRNLSDLSFRVIRNDHYESPYFTVWKIGVGS